MQAGYYEKLRTEMEVSAELMNSIAENFQKEMRLGLHDHTGSLKMLPSYTDNPSGQEAGIYVAIDFGGTNVRIMLIELMAERGYREKKRICFSLKDEKKGYDFTSEKVTGEELCQFLVSKIKLLVQPGIVYSLGYTFSFPCRADGINHAVLLKWTKEFKTAGVEGEDMMSLLLAALEREKLENVVPRAIINDTVGTQLALAYTDCDCDIATVLGTGHNTSYLEKEYPGFLNPVIINIESGNFNKIPLTKYDRMLDACSERPGAQLLEKMVAGRYLGRLAQTIVHELLSIDMKGFTTFDLNTVLQDRTDDLRNIQRLLETQFFVYESPYQVRSLIREICDLIAVRSAHLAAATLVGIFRHIDPGLKKRHTVAVEGSLYEKMNGYSETLGTALQGALGEKAGQVKLKTAKGGPCLGAAIAAAIAENNRKS